MAETTHTASSSNVAEFTYDEGQLDVTFRNGATYRYHNVPPAVHRAMQSSASAGEFLHRVVKPRFRAEKV